MRRFRPRLINPQEEFLRFRFRLRVAALGALLLFCGLFIRFVWLQHVHFERYHTLAENNRIALVPVVPARGIVLDRNGRTLASNESVFTLEITPSKTGGLEDTLTRLAEIIPIDAGDLKRFRKLLAESRNFESIPIRTRLGEAEAARFAVQRYRFPGVEVRARQLRQYPEGKAFAHVVGYIGRINDKDLERLTESEQLANYRGTDHMGKLGVEKSYEPWLHGRTGIEKVEVDSAGRAVRTLSRTPPQPGSDIYLHLDAELQHIAEQVFGEYRGALVALDPRNGGVLALVSKPGFDPNLFIDGIDQANWRELNDSEDRPLINRALRGIYPPGSTLKPFMALAGLDLGFRQPGDSIADPGYFSLPGSRHRFRDWKKDGHGVVDMKKSIVVSCDTYYYRLANEMGIQRMHDYLSQYGFGRKTQVDLDGELAGLLPAPGWKKKRFKQPWWPGETIIAGIGQGYTLATPMQLAVATMALANGGQVYKPQLVRAWRDPASGRLIQASPQLQGRIPMNPQHLALVRQAMVEVTLPGGTAAGAGAGAAYAFAGKTGTAQVVGIKQGARYDASRLAEKHRDHALFIAFAPADAPRIAVAVMVENGGHGGSTAAPIARKVMDYWLLGKKPQTPAHGPAQPVTSPPPQEEEAEDQPRPEEAPDAESTPPASLVEELTHAH